MAKRSDWARIERSRETRLWITQVAAPVVTVVAAAMTNERIRNWTCEKIAWAHVKAKHTIKRLRKK